MLRSRLAAAVVGVVAAIGLAAAPVWAADGLPETPLTVTPEPLAACELPEIDTTGGIQLAASYSLLADETTVHDIKIPEDIPSNKIIMCGDVEVFWLKGGSSDGTYMLSTDPLLDAKKCKAKLELLDENGKVTDTWETNQPAKPDDRLKIGERYGRLHFKQGKPGHYRLTVTCTQ